MSANRDKKIGAVINNASGTLTPDEAKERLEMIEKRLQPYVTPGHLLMVPGSQVKQEVQRLIDEGIDVLIIGGGDGTISTAAKLVGGTPISLAVLALGTRNHFARDMHIPLKPDDAIQLLDRMNLKLVDLGDVNGHKFINNATIGIYPKIVQEREEKTRIRGWQKWRAHLFAVFLALKHLPYMRMTIEGEALKTRVITPLLFVGNNEYQEIITFDSSRPSINGGNLWLCVMRSSGVRSLMRMIWQLSTGSIGDAEHLETHLLTNITVTPRRRSITVAIDGENHRLSTPLRFSIHKNYLRVIVP